MATKATQYTRQIDNVSVVYNIYRIVLPLVLLVTYISSPDTTILGELDLTLFVQTSTAYAIYGVLITFITDTREEMARSTRFLTTTLIIDIIALSLLIYSCGGIISGLGLLLIVTVASGSILIRGRISTFLAAIATIATIYSEVYLSFVLNNPPNQFLQAGILGTILFATSLYIQTVTNRAYRAAVLADQQASSIIDLEKLNNEIIQRMRTGIIVVTAGNRVLTMNSAARNMLLPLLHPSTADSAAAATLPRILAEQIEAWRNHPQTRLQLIDVPDSNTRIQPSFAFLGNEADADILVFLENHSHIMQRVQQMKLASLGRLTASIAHEVRNPLGAISHASQLLKESENISHSDQRMVEIILNHCNRVNHIIEHVLDVSRHRDVSPSRIELKPWLERFIATFKETHKDCDEIRLTVNPPDVEIKVIPNQLEQVLTNLFDNGIRYSKRGTGKAELDVVVGLSALEGEPRPFLQVIDKGAALDKQAQGQFFEPFHTTESSGTGLGLYISKELCEANQAALVYSATEQGTSCFSIYFSNPDQAVT
ncbi:MAG: sensor protein PilS [Pseudomonadota bacterium]|jgi:two-component system sensor histidine kinase PilS (NtrC family)